MVHLVHRSEREGEREKEQKVRACSKRSSFSQSVSMRDYYINIIVFIILSDYVLFNLNTELNAEMEINGVNKPRRQDIYMSVFECKYLTSNAI
jgi:hypothetical protein